METSAKACHRPSASKDVITFRDFRLVSPDASFKYHQLLICTNREKYRQAGPPVAPQLAGFSSAPAKKARQLRPKPRPLAAPSAVQKCPSPKLKNTIASACHRASAVARAPRVTHINQLSLQCRFIEMMVSIVRTIVISAVFRHALPIRRVASKCQENGGQDQQHFHCFDQSTRTGGTAVRGRYRPACSN